MTALCPGGGTSSANIGASAVTLLASGFAAVVLDKYGAGWLKWALPFLALPELTLNTFCATDPPAIPTFTAAESKALIDLQLGANFDSALSKFGDLVQHLAWYELCHCNSGTATALPAAPAPPAGTPVYAAPPAQVATPCGKVHNVFSQDQTVGATQHNASTFITWPAGATSVRLQVVSQVISGNATFSVSPRGLSPSAGDLAWPSFTIPIGSQDVTRYYQLPFGSTDFRYDVAVTGGAGLTSFDIHVDVFCNGAPPNGTVTPCCPSDPTLALQVEAILRMVTLIQRQGVPFGYVPGTVHAGLSGAGALSIQGILGAKVAVTTLPATLGRAGTTPVEYFDLGFLTFGTPDGYPTAFRLERDPQLLLPARCSAYTQLAYDLHPGVVVTITELLREP